MGLKRDWWLESGRGLEGPGLGGARPAWDPAAGPLDPLEEVEGDEDAVGPWGPGPPLLFFEASLQVLGGRVRWDRISGGSGGHSFPSRTGGGPVRLLEELLGAGGFLRAHLGARVELLLLMRWATVWCIHSTSG